MTRWSDVPLDDLTAAVAGTDLWNAPGIPAAGLAPLRVTDGPNGARGPSFTGVPSACFPCGTALGATWDPQLVRRVGVAIAQESRTKGAQVLLAPTVNLHRHPLAGRNFECYSEDPTLTAMIAVGFIDGVQSEGVGVTVKHFVANDSEFERMTISSEVDEAVLRELYLVPFEAAVTEAGAWGVMSAYNRLNGTYCSEHEWLLTKVLRDEWGFDGFVISDWFGTHSTAPAANAGLDLEMPGPPQWFGAALTKAVEAGDVERATVERMAERLKVLADRTGASDGVGGGEPGSVDDPAHRALIRETAAASFVLLQNDDAVLPLDRSAVRSVALIGTAADTTWIMGGGSAALDPHPPVTPRAGIAAALPDDVTLTFARGPIATNTLAILDDTALAGRLTMDLFDNRDLDGDPAVSTTLRTRARPLARRLHRPRRPPPLLRSPHRHDPRRRARRVDVRPVDDRGDPGGARRRGPRRRLGRARTRHVLLRVRQHGGARHPRARRRGRSRSPHRVLRRQRRGERPRARRRAADTHHRDRRTPPRWPRRPTSRSSSSGPARRSTAKGRTARRWRSPASRTRWSRRSRRRTPGPSCA